MRASLLLFAIVAAGCVVDDAALTTLESDLDVSQWQDDWRIPNQNSARQVALATFGGKVHMVHSGDSSPAELWSSTFDGTSWSPNVRIAGVSSSSAPALAVFGGRLRLVYRTTNGLSCPLLRTLNTDGTVGSDEIQILGEPAMVGGASMAVHDGKLLIAYCVHPVSGLGSRDTLIIKQYTGGTNVSDYVRFPIGAPADFFGNATLCKNVSIASFGGQLHVFHRAVNAHTWGNDWYVGEHVGTGSSTDGYSYERTNMVSQKPMSMVVCGGFAHMVHGGQTNPNEIWWSHRSLTASSWSNNVKVPDQEAPAGAALGCGTDGVPLMVHNGSNNYLWHSRFQP